MSTDKTGLTRAHVLIAVDMCEVIGQSRTVADIAAHVDVPVSDVRRHLEALRDVGLVRCSGPNGKWTVTAAGWTSTRTGGA